MIKKCPSCKPHEFQDQRYGIGRRVMNETIKGYRCTVCRTEHVGGDGKK